ncbi:MAG: DinB family protein [Candidatus Acidiferrales bacterium]
MADLSSVAAETFASYYEEVREQVHEIVAPLSTEQLWHNPYAYGNSIGHLLLHLTGNLSHYIGARIAGTGYVRNRPLEFADVSRRPKEEALAAFDRAIDMVAATIRKQSPEDWLAPYSDATLPDDHIRFSVIQRMAAHAYHHVGQMIYLAKELERSHATTRAAN